jgi:isopenicillin N synthase-like dioxygenase
MTEQSNSSLEEDQVPVIDLSNTDHDDLVRQIAGACSEFGFFQVSSHGIPLELLLSFRAQCRSYFALDKKVKIEWKRHAANARGYFDDELTKQRRDWKECLDLGVPYSRDWNLPDSDEKNGCLDGWNQFPSEEILPGFRNTMIEYFSACAELSLRLAVLMAQGLGRGENEPLLSELKERHTSYLRLNYYPLYCREESKAESKEDPTPLGISPHKDAGFLTVLLQDDGCHSLQVLNNNCWKIVHPAVSNDGTPSLTINTGDIAQVWSNGKYQAPLHRVLTNPSNGTFARSSTYASIYSYASQLYPDPDPFLSFHLPCLA